MIRIAALVAVAAFAAVPASAHEVRVSLTGKTTAQIEAEVAQAARTVCLRATAGESLVGDAYSRCRRATLKVVQAKLAAAQAD